MILGTAIDGPWRCLDSIRATGHSTFPERKGLLSMPSDNSLRSQRARIAALSRVAAEPSGTAMTETARRTFRDSFDVRHECSFCGVVEIDQALPAKERRRQAKAAYRAHMTRLSHRRDVMTGRAREAAASAAAADAELRDLGNAV